MTSSRSDGWDREQYARFREERAQPFYDLAALVEPKAGMRVIDLGCGPGRLTAWLHGELEASETVGIDTSGAMLEEASRLVDEGLTGEGLRFEQADIASYEPPAKFDLVFSNAALHWVGDHPSLFARLAGWLVPGGQLAVQVPNNWEQPSHAVARDLADEAPFVEALGGYRGPPGTLPVERYASLLDELGFAPQVARAQVYGHRLGSSGEVVEWVKGSLLTPFRERLPGDLYAEFVRRYAERLGAQIGEQSPYFFPFQRLLLWGRLG